MATVMPTTIGMDDDDRISVILLGAGLSTRMGRSKALLPWRGKTVLEAVCAAYETVPGDKVLVVGADAEAMASLAAPFGFRSIVNPTPALGQGRSLALGIAALQGTGPVLCGVVDQPLLTVTSVNQIMAFHRACCETIKSEAQGFLGGSGEQDVVSASSKQDVVSASSKQDVVATSSEQAAVGEKATHRGAERVITVPRYGPALQRGNPVLFGPYWRDRLGQLTGDEGGRVILRGSGCPYVQFCDIAADEGVDIDTPAAYAKLLTEWGTI